MLPLDDPKWHSLHGGYRQPYDPTPMLRRLSTDFADAEAWKELWDELHHQGDVGEASYASIPHLVRSAGGAAYRGWDVYALAVTIETEQHRQGNPPMPNYLKESYVQAWQDLVGLALRDLATATDKYLIRSALAAVAIGRGELRLGALLGHLDDSEIEEITDDLLAWPEVYGDAAS